MPREIAMQSVTVCVFGILVFVLGTGCVVASKSPMAEHVRVCGKLYKPAPSVVVVREEPQWLSVYDEDCYGSSLVSPQPKPKREGKAELSKVLDVAALQLQGLPRFALPVVNAAGGTKGVAPGTVAAAAGLPVIPTVPTLNSGAPRSVPIGSATIPRFACAAGQSLFQTDVYFARGAQEVSGPERDKLSQLHGRPIPYVFIEGLTEASGLTSSMVPLAQARAQAVQRVVQAVLVPGASIQQGLRAGCCTKQGESGSAGKDDLGVSVSACVEMVTVQKKGGASSMVK